MGFWLEWNLRQSAESNFTTALNSVHPSSIELFSETFESFCWALTHLFCTVILFQKISWALVLQIVHNKFITLLLWERAESKTPPLLSVEVIPASV